MKTNKRDIFLKGLRDGLPIGLGYFAVCFSIGITAKKAGLTPILGFISSAFTRASAGEYGGYTIIASDAGYMSLILMSLVTNLRYLLMSTALSQKFSPATPLYKRILVGCCVTDEIFGISIAFPGFLEPAYTFGAFAVSTPLWALGNALGIYAGGVLPVSMVSALSVALYGMFLAIIIPPAKKDIAVLISIIISFFMSYMCQLLPYINNISSGTRTIILTIMISAVIAIIKPVNIEKEEEK